MNLNELFSVFEGRNAPLYHGTSIYSALKAIDEDQLANKTDHFINGKLYSGVSLSRLQEASWNFGNVVFILDQRLLSQRYRILPHDYWGTSSEPALAGSGRRRDYYAEAEEFVVGAIKPLSVYLTGILMKALAFDQLRKYRSDFAKVHGVEDTPYDEMIEHPLLKVLPSP